MAGYRDKHWVTPRSMDEFYVYALYDEEGIPFYIGKGKGYRINNHTKPSSLKSKSYKNHKIKKLLSRGNGLRREILVYCDSEESSYEVEAFLIKSYGTYLDGGILLNHLSSHWDIPEKALKYNRVSQKKKRAFRVEDEKILEAYNKWKFDLVSITSLASELGISGTYLSGIFSGRKRKDLNLKNDNPGRSSTRSGLSREQLESLVVDRYVNNLTYGDLVEKYSLPKTTVARISKMEGAYSFLKETSREAV